MNLTLASSREPTLAAAFGGIVETWCGEDQATILRVGFLRRALGFENGRPRVEGEEVSLQKAARRSENLYSKLDSESNVREHINFVRAPGVRSIPVIARSVGISLFSRDCTRSWQLNVLAIGIEEISAKLTA